MTRWSALSDHPPRRQAYRFMRSLPYDLQAHLADRVPEGELFSDKCVENILTTIEARAGLRSGDEQRRCLREALFEFERQKNESLTEYITRREAQFGRAAGYRLMLSEEAKSLFLIEGAKLQHQGQQNLQTLLAGNEAFDNVANALRRLDTTVGQHLTKSTSASGGSKGKARATVPRRE